MEAQLLPDIRAEPKAEGTNRRQPELTFPGRSNRPHEPRRLPSPNVDGEAHSGRARTPHTEHWAHLLLRDSGNQQLPIALTTLDDPRSSSLAVA